MARGGSKDQGGDELEEFFNPQADQTECLCSRILASVEKRKNKRQRFCFEPAQRMIPGLDPDAVLDAARAIAGLKVTEPNGHSHGAKALEFLSPYLRNNSLCQKIEPLCDDGLTASILLEGFL